MPTTLTHSTLPGAACHTPSCRARSRLLQCPRRLCGRPGRPPWTKCSSRAKVEFSCFGGEPRHPHSEPETRQPKEEGCHDGIAHYVHTYLLLWVELRRNCYGATCGSVALQPSPPNASARNPQASTSTWSGVNVRHLSSRAAQRKSPAAVGLANCVVMKIDRVRIESTVEYRAVLYFRKIFHE